MANDFRTLFGSTSVTSVADRKAARLIIDGLVDEQLWITSLEGSATPNYQLMYAIGQGAYLNAFSQRLGMFVLKGLHITEGCNEPDNEKEPAFMSLYKQYNIVTVGGSSGDPLRMSFNNIAITGYIVKMTIREYSQQGIDGHAFELSLLGKIDGLDPSFTADEVASTSQATAQETITAEGGQSADSPIQAAMNQTAARGSTVKSGTPTIVYSASVPESVLAPFILTDSLAGQLIELGADPKEFFQ